MPAIILRHPKHEVNLHDPRDPLVKPDGYALPQLGHDTAIRATTPDEEQYCVCGVPTRHHFTLDLREWLGCDRAQVRQHGPRNPQRWNDSQPEVSLAIRRALVDGTCGPQMEQDIALYSNDEQISLAVELSRVAIAAYIKAGER